MPSDIIFAENKELSDEPAEKSNLEFIEIELPIKPSLDWLFWTEIGVVILFLILLMFALFWARKMMWGSLKIQRLIKTKLNTLTKNSHELSNNELKLTMQLMNQHFLHAKKQGFLAAEEQDKLSVRFNRFVFSQQMVSRETATALLNDFLIALQFNQGSFKDLFKQLLSGIFQATKKLYRSSFRQKAKP